MVRPLISDDAMDMASLHKTAFPAGWPAEDMLRHIQKDLCLGIGSPLKAFAIVQMGGNQADILTIATAETARRKGYARQLLEAIHIQLQKQGVETLYLDVSEINDAAIALYKTCDFQPVGRRPAYYRTAKGRVAAITFSKSL